MCLSVSTQLKPLTSINVSNINEASNLAAKTSPGWQIAPDVQPEVPTVTPLQEETQGQRQEQRSSASLMLLGVFSGLFLLYGWGWIEISRAYANVNELTAQGSGLFGAILQYSLFWTAPLAPVFWMIAALSFTKRSESLKLALILLAGAVILFPYPFVFAGGAA